MINGKHISGFFSLVLLSVVLASCEKINIAFGETASETDPNLTYFENYKTDIATYKPDSFLTSAHQVFSLGYHTDDAFGVIKAGSYAQINLPLVNTLLNVSAVFDSLELIIKPTGAFYGDSGRSMKINVHRLTENIVNAEKNDYFYSTSSFRYDPDPIGQQQVNLYGRAGTEIRIKLSDILGKELLEKFKSNADDIATTAAFISYFKGIYINTDSVETNSIAYFSSASDSTLIRLTYHETGLDERKKHLDFSYAQTKQFNRISFRPVNADFSSFVSNKTQVIASFASGNKSFLNTGFGSMIKISFPTLLNLKELHPYIKIIKAVLIVKPNTQSMIAPYSLPPTLNLYTTNETNAIVGGVYDGASTPALQTGSLYIDNLYGQNTAYSYDITSFINAKIAEGQFSTSALFLYPSLSSPDAGLQRLIVNDQTGSLPVQLKLYVLGL